MRQSTTTAQSPMRRVMLPLCLWALGGFSSLTVHAAPADPARHTLTHVLSQSLHCQGSLAQTGLVQRLIDTRFGEAFARSSHHAQPQDERHVYRPRQPMRLFNAPVQQVVLAQQSQQQPTEGLFVYLDLPPAQLVSQFEQQSGQVLTFDDGSQSYQAIHQSESAEHSQLSILNVAASGSGSLMYCLQRTQAKTEQSAPSDSSPTERYSALNVQP
ncbi:MAG: hypothetical protein RL180_748 [Pseudomonadota bacterium]